MRFLFRSILLLSLTTTTSAFVSAGPSKTALVVPTVSSSSSSKSTTALNGFGDLKGIADFFSPKTIDDEPETIKPKFETVVIDPDFRVAALFLSIGILLDLIPYVQFLLGLPVTALGILFLVQTFRIRFIFDETALELVTKKGDGDDELQSSGENVIVGGANRWDTESIINYDFFPQGWIDGPVGPILVYFKETQTPSESWNEGPGQIANDPEKIASGQAAAGQVHFFPAVCNGQQIREEFEKRGCRKI